MKTPAPRPERSEAGEAALVGVDHEGAIRFANAAFRELVQRADAEVIGRPIEAVLPVEGVGALLRRSHAEGRVMERAVTCSSRLSARRMLRLTVTSLPPAAADSILIIEDITEAEEAEAALRHKTEQLQAIAEAATMFVSTGNWRAASARLLRTAIGLTGSEYGFIGVVVAGPVLRILAHEGIVWDSEINRPFYEKALRTCDEVGYLEFRDFENLFGRVITTGQVVLANDPDHDPRRGGVPPGHPRLRSFLGVPILKGTQVVGMVGIANRPGGYGGEEQRQLELMMQAASTLYDGYGRHEREAALERHLRQAEKLAALGTLLGGMAHELNNPLFAISGRAELAQEKVAAGEPGEALAEDLAAIQEAAERATGVIQRVLGAARSMPERREPCAVNAIVERALELVANDCAIHCIAVRRDLQPDLPAVLADPEEVIQVLLNLFTNARQAMAQAYGQGTLTVTTACVPGAFPPLPVSQSPPEGSWIEVRIQDDGPGIAPEHLPRIFEPFFSTKPVGRGTGLGLWVSHRIVTALGGTLTCQSSVGQGATFLIRLPDIGRERTPA